MSDIDFELKTLIRHIQPELTPSLVNALIQGVATDSLAIREDNAAYGQVPSQDFWNYSHVDGVALVAICRLSSIEFFAIAADSSLIRDTEKFALVEVAEFLAFITNRFEMSETRLVLPINKAESWMEAYRERNDVV